MISVQIPAFHPTCAMDVDECCGGENGECCATCARPYLPVMTQRSHVHEDGGGVGS